MTRPRIRTLKPEIWQDEAIGHLDSWVRLLFIGLITMADDEGRLRALPALIAGHVFPYDGVTTRRLEQWIVTLHNRGLIVAYEHDGIPYVQIRGWAKHQKINRPTPTTLPDPSQNGHGLFSETSRSTSRRAA